MRRVSSGICSSVKMVVSSALNGVTIVQGNETVVNFNRIWKERDSAQPELLVLYKDNLNRAFKRVKARSSGNRVYYCECILMARCLLASGLPYDISRAIPWPVCPYLR